MVHHLDNIDWIHGDNALPLEHLVGLLYLRVVLHLDAPAVQDLDYLLLHTLRCPITQILHKQKRGPFLNTFYQILTILQQLELVQRFTILQKSQALKEQTACMLCLPLTSLAALSGLLALET